MLEENNVLLKSFRMVKEVFKEDKYMNITLRLVAKRSMVECIPPITYKIFVLVVDDVENLEKERIHCYWKQEWNVAMCTLLIMGLTI